MTSRVQKGSTVFRPVGKVRPRAPATSASRQTSVLDSSQVQSPEISLVDSSTPSQSTDSPSLSLETTATLVNPESQTLADTDAPSTDTPRKPVPIGAPILPPHLRDATPITPRLGPSVPTIISAPSSSRQPPRVIGTPIVIGTPRERVASPAVIVASNSRTEPQATPAPAVSEPSKNTTSDDADPSSEPDVPTNTQKTAAKPLSTNLPQEEPSSEAGPSGTQEEPEEETTPAPKRTGKRKTSSSDRPKKPKRKRSATTTDAEHTEDGDGDADADGNETSEETNRPKSKSKSRSRRNSRTSSSTPKPPTSRKGAPSPPPYDPDADPGEDIDPTTVTMAELCNDMGQGRVSSRAAEILSNHAAWKVKNREKRARMRLAMEAKKYGREEDPDVDVQLGDAAPASADADAQADAGAGVAGGEAGPSTAVAATGPTPAAAPTDETGHGFDYTQDLQTSRYNVQVRIGPNGETIIDEESLVVDRVDNDGTENYTHVVESDQTKFVNSGSYGKRYRGSRWSAEETELFFDALAQYGENYELIAYVLPGRDRKSCKNKFKVEDKRNHARINHCLNNSIPVDMKTLSKMTGKDFSGPVPEIRIPTPLPSIPPPPAPEAGENHVAESSQQVKKRSRSRSRGAEAGVVVLGNAENFDNGFDAE